MKTSRTTLFRDVFKPIAALALLAFAPACDGEPSVPKIDLSDKADGRPNIDPASCPDGAPRLVDGSRAAWTVIHYAAADNNLEDALLEDINEMEFGHRGSPNVNILVQLDKYSEDGVWRYQLSPDDDMSTINSRLVGESQEEPNSGDWQTLASFGRWAATCYPAENYMVVIGGHGGGWSQSDESGRDRSSLKRRDQKRRAREHGESLRLIAPDDTNGSQIYVDELAKALEAIRDATVQPGDPTRLNRLVAYGSDACLMQTMEVAHDLRNAVRYVVGSEENEPGQGWPYNTLVRSLTSRPWYYSDSPAKLMEEIVDAFGRSYGAGGSAGSTDLVTLAAVDTGALQRAKNRMETIASLLVELMPTDDRLIEDLSKARVAVHSFGDGYADLGSFMVELRSNLISSGLIPEQNETWNGDERWRELRVTLDELMVEIWPELVPAFRRSERYASAMGLSIFFPQDTCQSGLDLDSYARSEFAKDTGWNTFVENYLNVAPSQSSTREEVRGVSTANVLFDSEPLELSGICDRYGDDLVVETYHACLADDSSCDVPFESLGLFVSVAGDEMTMTAAYAFSFNTSFDDTITDVSIQVTDSHVASGDEYSGTVSFEMTQPNGDSVPITVSFSCTDFVVQQCSGDGWF